MNFLNSYFQQVDGKIVISASQGNDFAKDIANDFNPIHDTDAKRFCVPGDLLFSIALSRYGLHREMTFRFRELVKAESQLLYPVKPLKQTDFDLDITNRREKTVLSVSAKGASTTDSTKLEQLVKNYVAFSGHNFPHILVPLMEQHQVMINPSRPLVIYENMSLRFDSLDFCELAIDLQKATLAVDGKRGDTTLNFVISSNGEKIGEGVKTLVLSGLREYQQDAIDDMCQQYAQAVKDHG